MADVSLLNAIRGGLMDMRQPADNIRAQSRADMGKAWGNVLTHAGDKFGESLNYRAGLNEKAAERTRKAEADKQAAQAARQKELDKVRGETLKLEGELGALDPAAKTQIEFSPDRSQMSPDEWLTYQGTLRGLLGIKRKELGIAEPGNTSLLNLLTGKEPHGTD